MMALFIGLLALTGLMRLAEVAVSIRRMAERPEDVVAEPWLFPWMVVLHVGLVFGPPAEVWILERPVVPWLNGMAVVGLIGATVLRVWTLRTIGYSWNVRVVSPPPSGIATHGPYAWIRHPNYLVVILEIALLPLVHTAWGSCLVLSALNALVLFHRIRTEESVLARNPAWLTAFEGRARLIPGVL